MMNPQQTEAALETEILCFLKEELQAKGEDDSGLGWWYRINYAEQNRGYAPYQHAIADFLDGQRANFDRVTEVGAGIGQVCIHLSARGWQTIPIEVNPPRYMAMERLLDRIGRSHPEVRARIEPRHVFFPDNAQDYLEQRTVLVFASLGWGIDEDTRLRIMRALTWAGGVIIELRVFFTLREGLEQERLIEEVEQLGFAAPLEIMDWPGDCSFQPHRFVFFRRLPGTRGR